MKEIAGWIADKLGRFKLTPLGKPFHTFEALEFLTLGILGKRALWREFVLGFAGGLSLRLRNLRFAPHA